MARPGWPILFDRCNSRPEFRVRQARTEVERTKTSDIRSRTETYRNELLLGKLPIWKNFIFLLLVMKFTQK
jgi:hypothetical protein